MPVDLHHIKNAFELALHGYNNSALDEACHQAFALVVVELLVATRGKAPSEIIVIEDHQEDRGE